MKLIKPFTGLRPQSKYVKDMIAPPYDIVTTSQAKNLAKNKPYSFLHISKAEIDLPADIDPYSDAVYKQAASCFKNFIKNNILQSDNSNYYYIYRLTEGKHQQTGLVATASIQAYLDGDIKKHEKTRPKKVTDRVKNIEALNTQPSPVILAYRNEKNIENMINELCNSKATYDITDYKNVTHEFWVIENLEIIEKLTKQFNKLDELYIADGHHRVEAASKVAENQNAEADDLNNYFLAVLFPDTQLQILSYNRVFKDLNGLTAEQFIHAIKPVFSITESETPVEPKQKGQFGLYLEKKWYVLTIKQKLYKEHDPEELLEVKLLREYIVKPILDIQDPRNDTRVDFVGGYDNLKELEARVNSGEMIAAISLYPISIEELFSVADADETMPPKSTWFEPKLADGLICYPLTTTLK